MERKERGKFSLSFCVLSLVWFCFPPTLNLFSTSGGAVQFFIPNAPTILLMSQAVSKTIV